MKIVFASTRQIYGRPQLPARRRAAPDHPGRRQRHQQDGRRVVPPPLRRGLRDAGRGPAADEHLRPADARARRPADVPRLLVPAAPRPARSSRSSATARSGATSTTSTTPCARSCSPRASDEANGRVYNLGDSKVVSLKELAELLVRANGGGSYRLVPFPPDRKAIDIGDYYADFAPHPARSSAGSPRSGLEEGLRRSLDFYREHGERYWDDAVDEGPVPRPVAPGERPAGGARRRGGGRARRGTVRSRPAVERVRARVRRASAACRTRSASPPAPTPSTLALRAVGVGPGDEVITAANTCVPTVAAIEASGATAGARRRRRLATRSTRTRLEQARSRPAPARSCPSTSTGSARTWTPIASASPRRHGLKVVEDCGAGARRRATRAGARARSGDAAAFSFYPTKNLGALGDGGAVVTDDAEVADRARRLRDLRRARALRLGRRRARTAGSTTLQAAILLAQAPAPRRRERAPSVDRAPLPRGARRTSPSRFRTRPADGVHVFHLFVVRVADRDRFRTALARARRRDARPLPAAGAPAPGVRRPSRDTAA